MIKKSIYFFVVIFLTPNVMKCQEINILLKDYTLLEYVSSHLDYTRYIVRAKNENLWFDFHLSKMDDCDSIYKLNEYVEVDSSLVSLLYSDFSSNFYICIYKDNKIERFKFYKSIVYKILGDRIYVLNHRNWSLDADFKLLLTPNKNCYEKEREIEWNKGKIYIPDKEDLILIKIFYSKFGQKIFNFTKCTPYNDIFRYKYIKDLGCVEFPDADTSTIWRLNKIDNEIIEW